MALLWRQDINGYDAEQQDDGCLIQVDGTLLPPYTNRLTCTIASANDASDRAVAIIRNPAYLPQGASGGRRWRVQLVGATTLSNNTTIRFMNNTAGTPVAVVDIYLDSSKRINWFSDANTITAASRDDHSSFALADDTIYWVEIQWLCAAGGAGYKKLWINTDPTLVGGANTPDINITSLTGTPANVAIGEDRDGIDHLDGSQVTGYTLQVDAGQINDGAAFTDAAAPTNTVAPTIIGTPAVGNTATLSVGSWTDSPTLSYAWKRAGVAIVGATTNSYVWQDDDETTNTTCSITGTNSIGALTVTTAAVGPVAAATVVTPPPFVSGDVPLVRVLILSAVTAGALTLDPANRFLPGMYPGAFYPGEMYPGQREGNILELDPGVTGTLTLAPV